MKNSFLVQKNIMKKHTFFVILGLKNNNSFLQPFKLLFLYFVEYQIVKMIN